MRKTKIICTMGPAVDSDDKLRELMDAGMDAARFNFSHGSHEEHRERIERVRRIAEEKGLMIPTLLDTKGPEIRVRDFENRFVMLEKGQKFTLYKDPERIGNEEGVAITYPYLSEDISKGDHILIDDGLVSLTVTDIVDGNIECVVNNPGKVSNRKSINIPGVDVDQVYISETDRADIIFGIEMDIDFIAASFVRTAEDAKRLRKLLHVNGGDKVKVIAKIENKSGVDNIDDILNYVDGVMVARGDMGVEIPFEELPAIQKSLIKKCYEKGKIVITATQMLDSMQEHPRPTRAEVSDVANAIYDGTTCIMLSGETAAGKYPAEAVKAMSQIATYTETQIDYAKRYKEKGLSLGKDILNTIATASVEASFFLGAKAIVACTVTGKTAHTTSFYRPASPIIACCTDKKSARQLRLDYGVIPFVVEYSDKEEEIKKVALELARKSGVVKKNDIVILITGAIASANHQADSMFITKA